MEAEYISVAFSDHMSYLLKLSVPELDKFVSPKMKPNFKTSPEVIYNKLFKERLAEEMVR